MTMSAAETKNIDKKWYVVHTYSGFENKAKKSLEEKIKQNQLEEFFGDILIPMENVVEMVKGEKRASKRKFFPGYILVQMELNDRTWHLVKNTPKITGFVGNATKPPAVSEHEIARLTTQPSEGALKPKPKVEFEAGDNARVVDGTFSNFNGTVAEVNPDQGRVPVPSSMFSGAHKPGKEKVGTLKRKQLEQIAKTKMPDMTAGSLEAAMNSIAGTARSMGVDVEG